MCKDCFSQKPRGQIGSDTKANDCAPVSASRLYLFKIIMIVHIERMNILPLDYSFYPLFSFVILLIWLSLPSRQEIRSTYTVYRETGNLIPFSGLNNKYDFLSKVFNRGTHFAHYPKISFGEKKKINAIVLLLFQSPFRIHFDVSPIIYDEGKCSSKMKGTLNFPR